MNKEKIENFDKEQLELLLNDLQDIDKFTGFKNGAFKYEIGKYQASLLVNYIKKQKEVIDKAIEYIEEKYEMTLKDSMENFLDHDERIEKKRLLHILEILKNDFWEDDE